MSSTTNSKPSAHEQTPFKGSVAIGTDIFELLSTAMYVDPLCIYREYIQNSVDSIELANSDGFYTKERRPLVSVTIDAASRAAVIRDNGVGLPADEAIHTLTAIGGSRKRGTPARGFRGVGRLAGLGYCQQLVFTTKARGEATQISLFWDCRRLAELLRARTDLHLDDLLAEVLTIERRKADIKEDHFFEVQLNNLARTSADVLMNATEVRKYLSEVAPVPFSNQLSLASRIETFLAGHNIRVIGDLLVNGELVQRPYRDDFEVRAQQSTTLSEVEFLEIPSISSGLDAVGWIAHSDYLGAIPERHGLGGIRLRSGSIQIGQSRLLDIVFDEPRFNGWIVGEFHILSPKLIPNGRRDELEPNTHSANLYNHLAELASKLSKRCRVTSSQRAAVRSATAPLPSSPIDWNAARKTLSTKAMTSIPSAEKTLMKRLLASRRVTYAELFTALLGASLPRKNHTPLKRK